ncbi:MAG: ribosome small subunit-dependent GTPase A [Candidatus Velthaea sp.]
MNEVRRARVVAVGRNAAWVVFAGEREPRLVNFRKKAKHPMPVPGDLVTVSERDEHTVVDGVVPRSFALERRTAGGRTKTMAANVDTLAVVAALVDPPIHLAMIDRLIAFAVQHDVATTLLLTKADLAGSDAADGIAAIYRPLEIPVLVLQPKTGGGMAALEAHVAARHALLIGQSGVGKSSIFRALGGISVVGEVSRHGQGRQTTTSARLVEFADGFLIDSPGIGEFALDPMPPAEVAELFVEMRPFAGRCRFRNCRHVAEPDCAVRDAAADGRIALSRYASYREIATTG